MGHAIKCLVDPFNHTKGGSASPFFVPDALRVMRVEFPPYYYTGGGGWALWRLPPSVAETIKSLFLGRDGALPRVGMGVSRRQPPEAYRRPCGRLVGATAPVHWRNWSCI